MDGEKTWRYYLPSPDLEDYSELTARERTMLDVIVEKEARIADLEGQIEVGSEVQFDLQDRLAKLGDEVPAPARWLDGELNKAEARGAAVEKARWEARIEKLADKWDRGGEVVGGALPPAARELRSLLTGEGA